MICWHGTARTWIADEIHADFVYAPEQFVPVLSLAQKNVLSPVRRQQNVQPAGGLEQAAMLVPDEAVRAKINTEMERAGVRSGNLFALEGTRAAYEYGDAWLDGLMRHWGRQPEAPDGIGPGTALKPC